MKKNWLWLFIIALPLMLGSCQYSKRVPKSTVLTGEVINRNAKSPSAVKVMFTDPVLKQTLIFMLDSSGRFEARANVLVPQNHTLRYGDEFINFYTEPGDSVHITIDASRLNRRHDGVSFSGDHREFNNQFDRCYLHMGSLLPQVDAGTLNVPVDTLHLMMKSDLSLLKDSLNSYAKVHRLPGELVRHMETDLTYTVANLYADYKSADSSQAGRQDHYSMHLSPLFDPSDANLFTSMYYPAFLTNYSRALVNAQLPEAVLQGPRLAYLLTAAKLIAGHEPATLCRDHMLYALVWSMHREPGLESIMPELTFMFTNAYIADYLAEQVRHVRESEESRPTAIPLESLIYLNHQWKPESLTGEDFFEHLQGQYAGKVVYIDLYATWCGPCREEFAHSGRLHQHYKGKDVVFANLCMASEYNDWLPTLRRQHIAGENYFVDMAETELVHRIHRTERYPSFLLMDRQGTVVNAQAARPSQYEEITAQIDELLKAGTEGKETKR